MNKKAIELINELISDSEEKTNEYALYANDSHKMLDMVYYRGLSHGVKYVINKLDELKQLLTEEGKEVEFSISKFDGTIKAFCGSCLFIVQSNYLKEFTPYYNKYCSNCGQKLIWPESDGK